MRRTSLCTHSLRIAWRAHTPRRSRLVRRTRRLCNKAQCRRSLDTNNYPCKETWFCKLGLSSAMAGKSCRTNYRASIRRPYGTRHQGQAFPILPRNTSLSGPNVAPLERYRIRKGARQVSQGNRLLFADPRQALTSQRPARRATKKHFHTRLNPQATLRTWHERYRGNTHRRDHKSPPLPRPKGFGASKG